MNGTVSTSGRFYFPGERVAYKCLEGFVLFGADERTCHKNGTWSDEVPLCGEFLFCLARMSVFFSLSLLDGEFFKSG